MIELRSFQRRFVAKATRPGIDTTALSLPRGNGKSWLAAHLLTRALTPGDSLHVSGSEYLLAAASIEQARLCFRFVRAMVGSRRGYPGDSQARPRWAALLRGIVPAVAHRVAIGGDGQERRSGQHPAREERHQQHRARRRGCCPGAGSRCLRPLPQSAAPSLELS